LVIAAGETPDPQWWDSWAAAAAATRLGQDDVRATAP
jgi:hypothetical protein